MSEDKGSKKPPQRKLEVFVDDDVAQGVYSNGAMMNVNESEMTLDFLYVQPTQPKAKVRARVILSPVQAQRLHKLLGENIERFQKRFGKLPKPSKKDPLLH